ncbi:MAG: hypothetical protein ABIJ46_03080, partial [bacterium]
GEEMKKSSIAILAALVVAGSLVAYSIAVYGGRVIEAGDSLLTDLGDRIGGDGANDQAGGGEAAPAEPQIAQAGGGEAGDDQTGGGEAGDSSGGDDEPTAAQPPQAPAAEPPSAPAQPSGRVPTGTRYPIQGIASVYVPGQASVTERSGTAVEIHGPAIFRPIQPAVAPMAAPAGSIPVTELGPGICSAVVDRRAEQTVITVGGSEQDGYYLQMEGPAVVTPTACPPAPQ